MANYLIRLQLPDRPGALGAVASRIGALRGSVISIDILQRDGGSVIDELGVELDEDDIGELLVAEILEVDGVSVEAVRQIEGPVPDRHSELLDTVTELFRQKTPTGVIEYLTSRVRSTMAADFAASVHPEVAQPVAVVGDAPDGVELSALAATGPGDAGGPAAVVTAAMGRAGVVLVVGRADLAFRHHERRRIQTMAELADHRWHELSTAATVS